MITNEQPRERRTAGSLARTDLALSPRAVQTATLSSPLGPLSLAWRGGTLCALAFSVAELGASLERRFGRVRLERGACPAELAARLQAYFGGELAALEGIAVDPAGTPFQRRVWAALRAIPAGQVRSYAELASAIGQAGAHRAVGGANRANPIVLVIPCHRVVAAGGGLGGYSAGLERKRWLLSHEQG